MWGLIRTDMLSGLNFTCPDRFEVFCAEVIFSYKHLGSFDGGHHGLIQRINNGGIHTRIHHQADKSSIDDFALGMVPSSFVIAMFFERTFTPPIDMWVRST